MVFGGQARGFFSDTWAYDLSANRWQRLAADGAGPSRRYGHSGIYDAARDRMVISHGFTDSGRFDDTWAFEFATGAWRDISPSARPLRRCLHHAVYDGDANRMLMYGGCASPAGPCPLGDLWSFDLATNRWTEILSPARPPARQHYGIAFDSAGRRAILFGGSGPGRLNDTWEFDSRTNAWRQLEISGSPPPARSRHQGVADASGVSFFFGGSTPRGQTNELWMLGPPAVSSTPALFSGGVVNAFSGLGGAVAPGEIVSLYGAQLGPSEGLSLGVDAATGRLPVSGAGIEVTFNGVAAPLYFVSAGQLNVQVPYELPDAAEAAVVVTVNGSASERATVPLAPTHPGIFPRIFNADGSVNSPESPASPGGIVVLFATGQGATSPPTPSGAFPTGTAFPEPAAPASLSIGGLAADLLFRGQAPGTAGVMQLNVRIPVGLAPSNATPVVLAVGAGVSQPGVTLAMR